LLVLCIGDVVVVGVSMLMSYCLFVGLVWRFGLGDIGLRFFVDLIRCLVSVVSGCA